MVELQAFSEEIDGNWRLIMMDLAYNLHISFLRK
jgi:hypothetical protein